MGSILAIILLISILGCGTENSRMVSLKSIYGEINSNAPKETLQFGQLVGKWNVTSSDSIPNEGWHESKATWIFKYSLDGYAIEDTWFEKFSDYTNNTKGIGRDYMGKNIRIFDPKMNQWNISWIENGKNTMLTGIKGKEEGKNLVLNSAGGAEITFYNITQKSFEWKYELVSGDQRTLFSKMFAKRVE